MPLSALAMTAANAGIQTGTNLITGIVNNKMQYNNQKKLNAQQQQYNKEMTEYNYKKQIEMWEATGYKPTVEQMKKAGINPALMYGGSGQGGSTNVATSNTAPPQAEGRSMQAPNIAEATQMGIQLELLRAQKENIEADTANKKAGAQNLTASAEKTGLENAFTAWMQSTTMEGQDVGGNMDNSIRGKAEKTAVQKTEAETKFKLDENERQKLMNNKVMEKIGAEISIMAKEGKNLEEIYKNLIKTGLIMDAEIEWNKLDIEGGNVGKFITNIIKMALKPR